MESDLRERAQQPPHAETRKRQRDTRRHPRQPTRGIVDSPGFLIPLPLPRGRPVVLQGVQQRLPSLGSSCKLNGAAPSAAIPLKAAVSPKWEGRSVCSRVPAFKGLSSSGRACWPVWGFPRNGVQGSQGRGVGPVLPQSPAQVPSSVRKQERERALRGAGGTLALPASLRCHPREDLNLSGSHFSHLSDGGDNNITEVISP